MTRPALAALALVFALAHAPFLASTLDDIDAVNFALGLRDFDVAQHRPHPPGYPVYIAAGKAGASLLETADPRSGRSVIEARTLSVLSLAGALLAIPLLYRVFTTWSSAAGPTGDPTGPPWRAFDVGAVAATGLAVACPLFWYLAVRPMSDMPGLAAALAAQAALGLAWWRQQSDPSGDRRLSPARMAASGRAIVLGALLAGFAVGWRSQNAVLTLPLLLGVLADRIGRGVAGALIGGAVAFTAGALIWAVPLIVASGGLDAYLAALGSQAGEDFAGVEMLYLNPQPRLLALALVRTFLYPWDSLLLGALVTAAAAAGAGRLLWRDRRSLAVVALAASPYLIVHLLFQDTTYVRYALPLVPTIAFLAVAGLSLLPRPLVLPATAALAVWAVLIASPVTAAYGRAISPTAQAVAAMAAIGSVSAPGALAMHQTFRRPLEAETVDVRPWLDAPPRREWLELVEYWRRGQAAPLWFLADPRRTDLVLIDPESRRDRSHFAWPFASLSDIGGMRPAAVTWYRMPPPGWFLGEGWALSPETAGIARLMGRGPSRGPIRAWVRRRRGPVRVLVGGRHLGAPSQPPVRFTVAIDGRLVSAWATPAGFFLHTFELPGGALAGEGPLALLTAESTAEGGAEVPTAIEQFDLQSPGTLMWGYDEGWHEAEFTPSLGTWRWTSERATLRILEARGPVTMAFRVDPPRQYFDDDPIVRLRVGGRVLGETRFRGTDRWSVTTPLDALRAADYRVTIETSHTFVPAHRGGPPDRRRLGLRVFEIALSTLP